MKRISHSTAHDLPWRSHATVIAGLVLWQYARYTPMRRLDFAEILLFGVEVIALTTTARFTMRQLAACMVGCERRVLVGGGEVARTLIGKLAAHPEYRVEVVGSLTTDGPDADAGLPSLGTLKRPDFATNSAGSRGPVGLSDALGLRDAGSRAPGSE